MTESLFKVNVPIELVKGEEDDAGWKIRGLASTDDVDLQGEIVKQTGLDVSPIKEGRGWINYNHSNTPEDMVGKLNDAEVSDKGLMIEGYLFKKHSRAQSIYQVLKSLDEKDRHSVKLSIEGKILKRTGKNNRVIASAKVDKVAVTFDPINTNTYVELVKSIANKTKEWNMELEKAEVKEAKLTDENIMSPGDQKQEKEPANDPGTNEEVQSPRPNNAVKDDSKPTPDPKPAAIDLLISINNKLDMLTSSLAKAELKDELRRIFKAKLLRKLNNK